MPGHATMTQFQPLRVASVRRETRDAIVVTLAVPEVLQPRYAYLQGQHLTLRAAIQGAAVCRAYSICSAAQDRRLQVAIKLLPGGVFSAWAHAHIRPGMTIDVLPPSGGFHVPLDADAVRHYAGFAAGSGITPLLSIVATTLHAEPRSHFTLVYANRSQETMMFREALAALKNRYIARFSLIPVFSREQYDCALLCGRLDAARCRALFARWMPVAAIDYAFICGPAAMMDAVAGELLAHGLPAARIKREYFMPAGDRPALPQPPALASECAGRMTLTRDGVTRDIACPPPGQTILDAALAAGIDLHYACKGGVCATCRCRVVDGQVAMTGNYVLSDADIARGVVLSCRSVPVSSRVVLDFDRVDAAADTRPGMGAPRAAAAGAER